MKLYVIRKEIKAKSLKQAIRNENKAMITNVWQEEDDKKQDMSSVIGFAYYPEEED